jgi:hypothetical protein
MFDFTGRFVIREVALPAHGGSGGLIPAGLQCAMFFPLKLTDGPPPVV